MIVALHLPFFKMLPLGENAKHLLGLLISSPDLGTPFRPEKGIACMGARARA
jgi:hypothetical protein